MEVSNATHTSHLVTQCLIVVDVTRTILDAVKEPFAEALVIELIIGPPANDAHTVSVLHQPRDRRASYVSGTASQ
jgi:hypothetical protein